MGDAQTALTALTIVIGLSLLVERTLEVLKHLIDFGNDTVDLNALKARTEEMLSAAEAIVAGKPAPTVPTSLPSEDKEQQASGPLAQMEADAEPTERYAPPKIPLVPMAPLSANDTANDFFLKFAAAGLGIVLAYLFDLHMLQLLIGKDAHPMLDTLFTGLLIGGGSQPVHLLLRFMSERKVTIPERTTDDPAKQLEQTKALARVVYSASFVEAKKEPQPLQWSDIPYRGGVFPERLNNVHKRSGNPTLIVYHHTAMSSASSFEEVVNEFLVTKKWMTGYHCVIMPDGTVKPFCRWDRYGNHAAGLNARSLGISFHGNFHTLRDDPFSNADGRFGNQQPTEAQLHAGARVIALWAYLYNIDVDFAESILPHRRAMPGHTVCPGSNFPEPKLEELVRQYYDAWSRSPQAQAGIRDFRQMQYVYA